MHILGDDQRSNKKKRTSTEVKFQRVNTLIIAAQLACLIVTATQLLGNSEKELETNIITSNEFKTTSNLNDMVQNCVYNVTTSSQGFTYTMQLNNVSFKMLLAKMVREVRVVLLVHIGVLVTGSVNKVLFEFNVYEVQYHHLIVRKDMFTLLEISLIVTAFVLTFRSERLAAVIKSYLKACNGRQDSSFTSTIPFVPHYDSLCIVLSFHFLSLCAYVSNALKRHPEDMVDGDGKVEDEYGGNMAPQHLATSQYQQHQPSFPSQQHQYQQHAPLMAPSPPSIVQR